MEPNIIPNVPIPVLNTQTPNTTTTSTPSSQSTSESQTGLIPATITDKVIPETPIAVDVIGTSLDTDSRKILGTFTFGQVGALQIGTFSFGISGQINISPSGIKATNVNNQITFTLDGTTGNATFLGTLQAGSLIAGAVNVGSANVQIDGANGRIIVNDGTFDRVLIGQQTGGF